MTEKKKNSIEKLNLLIALVLAFAAWVYVIYNYAPMKEVYYTDVPIQFEGEDTLAYKGLAVESSSIATVRIKAKVKRTEYLNTSADSFDVVADVSSAVIGENGISLTVSSPENATVENMSVSSVTVSVAKAHSKQVRVLALYSDAIETNVEPSVSSMGYRNVTVSGAEKNLDKVKCAAVIFAMNELNDQTHQFYREPIALDKNGKAVAHIVVVPSEISVSAYSGNTKEVPLTVNIIDASSSTKKYEAPQAVVIKGRKKILDQIKEIKTEAIDISKITEDTEIPLTYILPDGVDVTREYAMAVLKVHIEE